MAAKIVKTNQYEAMFLFAAQAGNELDATIKTVRGMIEKHGGEVLVAKKWDERKLAYEVGKQKRGIYILSYFKAPTTAIVPLERDVNLSDNVLRVLITHADHLNVDEMNAVEPQPIQPREERNPWDRPGFNDAPPRGGDRPRDDRPRDDRPRDDRPHDDRPRDDRPRADRPAGDRPVGDRPAGEDRPARAPRARRDELPAEAAKD